MGQVFLLIPKEEYLFPSGENRKMKNTERKLLVVYVVLPLVILSFSLGALMIFSDSNSNGLDLKLSRAFSTLTAKPISLMSPDTSGDLFNEMNSVRDIFTEFNEDYGSRLSINVATGASATLPLMRSYISTTERMHLAAHGTWNSVEGPKITMYGGYLTHSEVSSWSLTGGNCKVIYLSACNGMGHDGILNTDLATELRIRTSVEAVVGFKDEVNIVAATLLSQSFWGFHVAYTYIGGISSDTSFTNSISRIQMKIDLINSISGIAAAVAVGWLVGLASSGIGSAFLAALLAEIISGPMLALLMGQVQDTLNSWELIGTNVPGLYWPSGGGGGGGKPPVNVID